MASSVQMMKPSFCRFNRELGCFSFLDSDFQVHGKGVLPLRRRRNCFAKGHKIYCKFQDADGSSKGDEPPESLFTKELRRRGISPTSLLEDSNRSIIDEEIKEQGGDTSFSKRNAVATDSEKSLTNQREQSMALNSEGLEGLVPRAKLLLTLGGTFFLGFWPLILTTVAAFAALYLYFGPTFIHDASENPAAPPPYIDPYVLLQEERIAQ